MPFRVPAQRRHAVAQLNAAIDKRIRDLLGLIKEIGIGRADNMAFHAPSDDFSCRIDALGVFEDFVNRQRPVLHDTQHGKSPCNVFVFGNNCLI